MNFEKAKKKLEAEPFIAVHVRGGDYLNKTNIYHKIGAKYYLESLKDLREKFGDIRVLVFSDDPEYARNIFSSDASFEILNQDGLRASEAMILMSSAKGIVTANSTFSYWAAMINAGNHIYAPRFWYTNAEADKNLYPPHWKLI
jgi:hypothetical protein